MEKFINVNINLKELEKDYWEEVLKDYIRKKDNTKSKYIINKYKYFMKIIMGIREYKNWLVKSLWKYWTYLLSIPEYANEDNSIDMNLFQEKLWISNSSLIRLIKIYKDNNVLKKRWFIFYLNPLLVHYGKDIKLELWILFEEELKKVWIIIK
jgi:hypothetical protein